MIRPILQWPDKRLRTIAEPVDAVTDEVRAVWDDMVDTMMSFGGVGLAAPQIGVLQRLAIVDAGDTRAPIRMANPEVLHASVEMRMHEEGSPCLPGVSAKIERPRAVTVRYLNESGESEERDLVLLWATSMQHQIDHLNGRLFFENLSKLKRDMLLKKARKVQA
jgi:peptide deformylase